MSIVMDIDNNALLAKYGNNTQQPTQRLRKNVQLLFLGLSAEETAPLITLLRTSRIAPRGKQVNSEKEFLEALSERSWDLILCTIDREGFTSKQAISHLKRLGKDIPIVQIIPSSDSKLILQGLKNHIQAVVPLDEKELVMLNIRRELANLETRRRLRKAEAALAEENKRARQLMDNSKNAIACSLDNKIVFCNDSFAELFDFDNKEQALGKLLSNFFISEDRQELAEHCSAIQSKQSSDILLQLNALRPDKSEFAANIELSANYLQGENEIRVMFRVDDHNIGHLLSEDLDFVSGLFNRTHLQKQLEQITQAALRGGNDCSLLYIELDQYHSIKARLGNETADQLIRESAALLRKAVNSNHLLSHYSEDTFVIVYRDPDVEKAQRFAQKLCRAFEKYHTKNMSELHTTCSIGMTLINDSTPPQDELLARGLAAIVALREENLKGNGVMLHAAHTCSGDDMADDEFAVIQQLVANKEFKLLYQPVVNLTSDDRSEQYYEVLLRLMNDEQNELSPSDFMSAVGDKETAIKVDHWVIEHSLKNLKEILNNEDACNTLFINISAHSHADPGLFDWLKHALEKNEIPPERLIFQISESDIAISPEQSQAFAEALYELKCRVCIKHFGSTPNPHKVLSRVRSDFIKLDGSYIQDLGKDEKQDQHLFEMVEQLTRMEKHTIAPLVENTKTMAALWKAGIGYVQGYYLQPPREKMDYDFFSE